METKMELRGETMEDEAKKTIKKLGGIKTMPFILGTDMCERFASTGFHANMITYLTQQLNMALVQASNTLSIFAATSSLASLLGALIADSFAGRFWTIAVSSFIYQLALVAITISAVFPRFHPPPCPTQENCVKPDASQLWPLYLSLLLTTVGSGGIRPCVVTFAADQLDMSKAAVGMRKWSFFNWYYFSMGLATLSALTIVVFVQDNVGWGWGLGLPTLAMALSIVAFAFGSPLYKRFEPAGSPLVRLVQVVVAAFRKREEIGPENPTLLYQNTELDAPISLHGRLVHTHQFKWFDKAAIVTNGEDKNSGGPNLWRIATVHRVEELKSIIRMLPIWASSILLVTSSSHQHSFTVVQARTMDRHLSRSFQIQPATLSVFGNLSMLTGIVIYDRAFVPIARRISGNPSGVTCLQRMGIGFAINILATVVSSFVEIKRKSVAAKHGLLNDPRAVIPISVFWLVPQFWIHGIGEVFMAVGHLEFLYDQSPESLRSTAVALYWIAIAIGNYLGSIMVSLVHKLSGEKRNWIPDRNLNNGRLECYYWLVSGIQVINLIYYVICAWVYTYKPLEEIMDMNKEEEEEEEEEEDKLQKKGEDDV